MRSKLWIRQEILSLLEELNTESKGVGSLFIIGDNIDGLVQISIKGDMPVLAQAFGSRLERNDEFKRLMFSMFGSYLSNNKEDKEVFLNGLKLDNNPINLN